MDRKIFYEKIKDSLFGGKLLQSQVDGIEAILEQCEKQAVTDLRHIAYILGTIFHEVGGTMRPIEEIGKGKNRTYGHRVWYSGKPYTDIKTIFYGRGLTQNTWRDIYAKLTKAAQKQGYDWNFEDNPELLLLILPSAWASVYAMKTGLYTGVSLSRYFNNTTEDYINARRIVNLLDKAELIKGYALKFFRALQ